MTRICLAISLATGLVGACGSPAPPALEAPPTTRPATRLPIGGLELGRAKAFRWEMEVAGVSVASFELKASPVGGAVRVVARGETSGVGRFFAATSTQAASVIGAAGETVSTLIEVRSQGAFRRVSMLFDKLSVRGTKGDANATSAFALRAHADLRPISSETFLLALRQWRPRRGDRALATVVGQESAWLIEMTAAPPRTLKTPVGEMVARELVGRATRLNADGERSDVERSLSVFLSEDERRLPLRVEAPVAGTRVVVSLVEFD